MANTTGWVAGRLFGDLAWHTAFVAANLNSMINGNSVLSSTTAFTNGTALDQFMDISAICTVASSAIVAGANLGIWLAMLQEDGSTLGDGLLTAGTQATYTAPWPSIATIPLAASTRTTLTGGLTGLLIPPGTFALILQNNSNFTFAASTNACQIRTYNLNLNA